MTRAVASLESHLGYWLRAVSNQVSGAFAGKVEALGVSVAEWVILRLLFDKRGAAPSELADLTGMTRGAISKLADRMMAKKLIAQSFDTEDRRYQKLSLTPAGRALVPRLAALADQNEREFFGHLKAAERKAIETLMRGIIARRDIRSVPVD
ncbi:MAG: MarR family transcriptional regulator [Pseudolabrys sp.]|nr:MarR family transcriptional regulator [Pseudolabrys sp.]